MIQQPKPITLDQHGYKTVIDHQDTEWCISSNEKPYPDAKEPEINLEKEVEDAYNRQTEAQKKANEDAWKREYQKKLFRNVLGNGKK